MSFFGCVRKDYVSHQVEIEWRDSLVVCGDFVLSNHLTHTKDKHGVNFPRKLKYWEIIHVKKKKKRKKMHLLSSWQRDMGLTARVVSAVIFSHFKSLHHHTRSPCCSEKQQTLRPGDTSWGNRVSLGEACGVPTSIRNKYKELLRSTIRDRKTCVCSAALLLYKSRLRCACNSWTSSSLWPSSSHHHGHGRK